MGSVNKAIYKFVCLCLCGWGWGVDTCNALFVLKSLKLTPVTVWVTPRVFTAVPGCTTATGAVVRYLEGCEVGCAVG